MENKEFRLSDRVTVLFEAMPLGYYLPRVIADGESQKIPLIFYPELDDSAVRWLKAIEGLDEPLNMAYHVVAGALLYAQKYPDGVASVATIMRGCSSIGRASDCHSEGSEIETRQPRHFNCEECDIAKGW